MAASSNRRSIRVLNQQISKEDEIKYELMERLRTVEEIIKKLRNEEELNEEEINSREREASEVKTEIIDQLQLIEELKEELTIQLDERIRTSMNSPETKEEKSKFEDKENLD